MEPTRPDDMPDGIRRATADDVERIEALQGLRALVAKERVLARERQQLVERARESGASWALIAGALGVTQQAVSARYGRSKTPTTEKG